MEFTLIRDRIKQYKLSSLVHNILETLNLVQTQKEKLYPYWKLLVLLKWCYLNTDDSPLRKNVSSTDIKNLLDLIEKFEVEYDGLNFKSPKGVAQSFRIMAYQQFSYQENFYNSVIDRQLILFIKLKTNLSVEAEFKRLTAIELSHFFNHCYLTYIYVNANDFDEAFKYDGKLHEDYFLLFKDKFSPIELSAFLNLLTIKDASQFENLHKLNDERLQLYETNFFITKPFLLFRNEYRVPHRSIFTQTIKHFVYTYLKALMPDTFPDDFGKRLERYVELGLKECNLIYQNESTLKKQYKLSKVVDYKIEDDILLECKATELHPRSGVLRLPNMLTKEMNTSIVKAYSQLLSTANAINNSQEWYGIIITYREMYLGFGADAWEEFMKEPIEKFATQNKIYMSVLPPQNLFFVTIEYWDYMVQVVKESRATIKQILEKAKDLNSNPNPMEKVFLIEQVLLKHFSIDTLQLSYLNEAHSMIDVVSKN